MHPFHKPSRRGQIEIIVPSVVAGIIIAVALISFGMWLHATYLAPRGAGSGPVMLRPRVGDIHVRLPESDQSVVQAVQKVGPAVVYLKTTFAQKEVERDDGARPKLPFDWFREWFGEDGPRPRAPLPRKGEGSGVIIDSKRGYVLTNAHVVADSERIEARLPDGRRLDGKLVGVDELSDMAVVQIRGRDLPDAELASAEDLDNLPIGSWVIAIGNPFGYENSVTVGVVSAVGRVLSATDTKTLENLIQTDAAINPGNSGGPLVNLEGKIIGINTAIFSLTGAYVGIGFAIAADKAAEVSKALISGQPVKHPYIGVGIREASEMDFEAAGVPEKLRPPKGTRGAYVESVVKGGPADKAGIEKHDVITEVGGTTIDTVDQVVDIVRRHEVGERIDVVIRRGKQVKKLRLRIGEMSQLKE